MNQSFYSPCMCYCTLWKPAMGIWFAAFATLKMFTYTQMQVCTQAHTTNGQIPNGLCQCSMEHIWRNAVLEKRKERNPPPHPTFFFFFNLAHKTNILNKRDENIPRIHKQRLSTIKSTMNIYGSSRIWSVSALKLKEKMYTNILGEVGEIREITRNIKKMGINSFL